MLFSPRSSVPGVRLRSVPVTRKARCRRGERLGWAQYHWFMEASSYPTLRVSRLLAMYLENLIFFTVVAERGSPEPLDIDAQ